MTHGGRGSLLRPISLLIVGGWAAAAQAQVVVNRASTVAESEARGFADVVRAQGEFNLMNSEAMINAEQARRQQLENNLRQTQVFFERRALNQQQRFGDYAERAARNAQRAARDTQRQYIRYGQAGRPTRLTSQELDPLTGKVTWPLFLRGPEYAQPRETIGTIMQLRAMQDGALTLEEFQIFQQSVEQMREILRSRIREKNSMDFINTRRFIDRLVEEVRNPA